MLLNNLFDAKEGTRRNSVLLN